MMPVTSATMPAANHTMTQIWLSEMPTDSAALWLSATARSARPMRVYWKNTASTRHQRGDDRRGDVELLEDHEAAEHLEVDRAAWAGRARR
jgi:hypothetical protein